MAHSAVIAVKEVAKMKARKGINSVIDTIKNVLSIEVDFDDKTKLELKSGNKNCIDIAVEWIEQDYGDKKTDPMIDIQDSVVWTFSERTSSTLRKLYKEEVDLVENLSDKAPKDTDNQIVITCSGPKVSDMRPKLQDLMKKYKDTITKEIKVGGKGKTAKKFCETTKEDSCIIIYDEKGKQILVTSKSQSVINGVKDKWEVAKKSSKTRSVDESNEQKQNAIKTDHTPSAKDKVKQSNTSDTKELESKGSSVQKTKVRVSEEEPRPAISNNMSDSEKTSFTHPVAIKSTRGDKDTNAQTYKSLYPDLKELEEYALEANPDGATGTSIIGSGTQEGKKYIFKVGRIEVLIYKESIVEIQKMDAVVNAANDHLAHAGGVALFISKSAGKNMDDECNEYIRKHGQLKVSDVFVSKPGKMKCKGIFHAVGPRWSEYIGLEDKCAEDLYNTVFKCLERMDERKWKSIALCAISSGIFGVPKQLCTAMYLKAIEDFAVQKPKRELEIHFIDVNTEILDHLITTHKDRLTSGQPPSFRMAFDFPSAKKGYASKGWGGQNFQAGTRPREEERGLAPGGAAYRHGYGHAAASDAVSDHWQEHRPETVKSSAVDIEQFFTRKGELSNKKGPVKNLKVQAISKGKCTYCEKKASKKLPCEHIYCNACYVNSKDACQKCKAKNKSKMPAGKTKEDIGKKMPECPICYEEPEEMATLKCSHQVCRECLKCVVAQKPACPVCGQLFGMITGTQPDGKMFYRFVNRSLPGYDRDSTIEILYQFQKGNQKECHPNPGRPYDAIERGAFLPDNAEGRHVLELLKKAWSRRLIFTIGESRTTGQTGQITWNDIHHKTKPSGGQFGYPDPTYLQRVQEELAAKGVTD